MPKSKCYAVRKGRNGPAIYLTWEECKANVSRFPGAIHKSFTSRPDAEKWLQDYVPDPYSPKPSRTRPSSQSLTEASCPTTRAPGAGSQSEESPIPNQPIQLSDEQKDILQKVINGQSVFFTGSAGTGKSVLLREIISALGGPGNPELAVTASTGIASVNIGGTTLHSWAGVGLLEEDRKKLADKFMFQEKFAPVKKRWRETRTLIIDEISMVDGYFFDVLAYIAQRLRENKLPFGGITLVLSGDFCQLPPVPSKKPGQDYRTTSFAFEAESWPDCIASCTTLTHVFRQKDKDFVELLNAMRLAQLTDHHIEAIRQLVRPVLYTDGIEPTELYPTRSEVDEANNARLAQLTTPPQVFEATDSTGVDAWGKGVKDHKLPYLLDRVLAPPSITLKVGAQVMLIKNMVQGVLVNGSVGQIIDFSSPRDKRGRLVVPPEDIHLSDKDALWPLVRFINGMEVLITPVDFTVNNCFGEMEARRVQIPLILAWSLSTHKSQGQTLERVKVNLDRTFEHGQAYVALSRATSMDQLQVLNFRPHKVTAHPKVIEWTKGNVQETTPEEDWDEMIDDEIALASYHRMDM